jgi:cation transport ATPase
LYLQYSIITFPTIADISLDITEDEDDEDGEKEYNVMAMAAALENQSSHPVANAVVSGIHIDRHSFIFTMLK